MKFIINIKRINIWFYNLYLVETSFPLNITQTVSFIFKFDVLPLQKKIIAVKMEKKLDLVKKAIKEYPDFPKKGIMFQDIFGVLLDPLANEALNDLALDHVIKNSNNFDKIVALDSRGFLFGNSMALAVKKPFVPVRKKGKLPGKCTSVCYTLEYGQDTLEIQEGSLQPGDRVLIVDDLLATGGTLSAASQLVKAAGAVVDHCWVVIELSALGGRAKAGEKVEALIKLDDVE